MRKRHACGALILVALALSVATALTVEDEGKLHLNEAFKCGEHKGKVVVHTNARLEVKEGSSTKGGTFLPTSPTTALTSPRSSLD